MQIEYNPHCAAILFNFLSMASSLTALAKPFTSHSAQLFSNSRTSGVRRNSLRISAITKKYEPTKVVPQADRVLIRLEELAQTSAGGVLLPKSAVKFERYLVGEVLSTGSKVSEVESGKKVLFSDINAYESRIAIPWRFGLSGKIVWDAVGLCGFGYGGTTLFLQRRRLAGGS